MNFGKDFSDSETYYDVLDISTSATPAEVREAYLRAKSAYNKDSVALYSLIDSAERESTLDRIEEAYVVLSNEDKRRQYDAHHGILETSGILGTPENVISIDRVPPMEVLGNEDLLVPPPTDFAQDVRENPAPRSILKGAAEHYVDQDLLRAPSISTQIHQEIVAESEWRGSFLKRIRETQNISLEEMSNVTKISKTYLQAIETEEFKKLPALVFVRGFLTQICRVLKIPQDKALEAYLERFKAAKTAE